METTIMGCIGSGLALEGMENGMETTILGYCM